MKILIVEDEDDIRTIVRLSLERLGGMSVIEARSGRAALEAAARDRPDAILLDVMMPELDGAATLAALRRDPGTSGIPVIFLTAKALPGEVERLKGLGAAAVLTKPFDPGTLPGQVRAAIESLSAGGTPCGPAAT
jgi:CheY-like chemotaxis protein